MQSLYKGLRTTHVMDLTRFCVPAERTPLLSLEESHALVARVRSTHSPEDRMKGPSWVLKTDFPSINVSKGPETISNFSGFSEGEVYQFRDWNPCAVQPAQGLGLPCGSSPHTCCLTGWIRGTGPPSLERQSRMKPYYSLSVFAAQLLLFSWYKLVPSIIQLKAQLSQHFPSPGWRIAFQGCLFTGSPCLPSRTPVTWEEEQCKQWPRPF